MLLSLHCAASGDASLTSPVLLFLVYVLLFLFTALVTRLLLKDGGEGLFAPVLECLWPPHSSHNHTSNNTRGQRETVNRLQDVALPASPSERHADRIGCHLFRDTSSSPSSPDTNDEETLKDFVDSMTQAAGGDAGGGAWASATEGVSERRRDMLRLLARDCCALPVCGRSIRVLHEPKAFYDTLCALVAASESSITLCALYLGDGSLAKALMERVVERVGRAQREGTPFRVVILLDFHRMRDRKNLCSLTGLLSLAAASSSSKAVGACVEVRVFLYQHPSRWTRRLSPLGRAAEALGVQHAKIFVIDGKDTILTGANLSDDYFTTRLDRYLVVSDNEHVGTWFDEAVRAIASISHPVTVAEEVRQRSWEPLTDARGVWKKLWLVLRPPANEALRPVIHGEAGLWIHPNACGSHPSLDTAGFIEKERSCLLRFAADMTRAFSGTARRLFGTISPSTGGRYDTIIFPTLQCGPAGIFHDSTVTEALLRLAGPRDRLFLTSPYMNLHASYVDAVLAGAHQLDCVTAGVSANGWKSVKGASFIPLCYLQLERAFYYLLKSFGCLHRVRVREFVQPGWTFHSKGIWFFHDENENENENEEDSTPTTTTTRSKSASSKAATATVRGEPYLVSYGSTNYGYRSVHRDMEVALMLFTANSSLKASLKRDLALLLERSEAPVEEAHFLGAELGRYQPVVSLLAQLGQGYL